MDGWKRREERVGWGVLTRIGGVTGGGRWQPVNLKILPDLGTLHRPIWWVWLPAGFVISPPHPATS